MDKGAHFYRCDLQVHTPRDRNWTGADAVSNDARRSYAARLITACRERSLHAIAITDHHDMAFVPYVRSAAEEETDDVGNPIAPEDRLVVFPGMELTLGVPCQALVIFDADFPQDLFALTMTALAIEPCPEVDAKAAEVQRLDKIDSLTDLKLKLDEYHYLRDRYIIFPNVGENGDYSLIRKGLAGKYKEMPCVGGFVDGQLDKLGQGTASIIQGKAKEWGHKRIACFQTSDNRREDHRDLGRSTTWIKWAVPTAEALRQACLARESRVSQDTPLLPSVTILGMSVSNSSFLGPVDLNVNPQYSAIIGGRGTGKSTILEYLRWALCDQPPPSVNNADAPNYMARRGRLIDQTLKPLEATTEVRFEVNRVPHIVRRDSKTGDVLLKIGDADMQACTDDDVRRLLPIQAYSQKQLSDVSVRVEELSRFIATPIRARLEELDSDLANRVEHIRTAYAALRRQRTLSRMVDERNLAERSLSEQAEALRSRLTGLSDDDRTLLESGNTFWHADEVVSSWRDGIVMVRDAASEVRSTVASLLSGAEPPPNDKGDGILQDAYGEYRKLLVEAQESLDNLAAHAGELIAAPEAADDSSPWRQWAKEIATFRTSYAAAVERSSAHKEMMEELQLIEQKLQAYIRETGRVKEQLKTLGDADQISQNEREAWEKLLEDRDAALNAQCAKLTADSDTAIRAHVKRYADSTELVATLKQAVSGSRVPGGKLEAIGEAITREDSVEKAGARWHAIIADLESLAEFDLERDGIEHRPEAPALTAVGLTNNNLDGIARSLTSDDWLKLSLTPVASEPIFEYRAREQEYIPFRNASAGQQATALLKTLLNQPGPPLIIDQPEEDLDNPVMLEIAESIWKAKRRRQLIFASHNANLVVNGDAELIAWCDYRTAGNQSGGKVEGQGAIDVEDVREAIKRIMEGGERAFNLRKEKYGF